MATEVSICNNALYGLGESPITSLDDATNVAQLCKSVYADARDALLSEYDWNFALRRASLSQNFTGPVWEYAFSYQLPTDPKCLRVSMTDVDDTGFAWKVEGTTLLTDASSVSIKYVAKIEDTTQFSAHFVEALQAKLAYLLASPITGSLQKEQQKFAIYKEVLKESIAADLKEGTPNPKFMFFMNALKLLGEKYTSMLTDGEIQRLYNGVYVTARDSLLTEHPWNFAIARAVLVTAAQPVWEYTYAFSLPTSPYCLRVLKTDNDEIDFDWKIEGRTLLTNHPSVSIKYISRVSDTALFPPMFVEALEAKIAYELALPVVNAAASEQVGEGRRVQAQMLELYKMKLRNARLIDGQEGTPDRDESTELTIVRN